jgi:hypothetical protein
MAPLPYDGSRQCQRDPALTHVTNSEVVLPLRGHAGDHPQVCRIDPHKELEEAIALAQNKFQSPVNQSIEDTQQLL